MQDHAEIVELAVEVEQVGRVAAIDVSKASAMVCTRLLSEKNARRRVPKVWAVAATTDEIIALGDHLVCQGRSWW